MRAIVLALGIAGLPVADDDGASKNQPPATADEPSPITRFSEPAQPEAVEPPAKPASTKARVPSAEDKKVIDGVRDETNDILEQVRNVISGMEKGDRGLPDITVLPPPTDQDGKGCDVDVPSVLRFELERIRAIRDEAQIMIDLHDKNVLEIEQKLGQLEVARAQLDRSREALEKTLSMKSSVDSEQKKERQRLRLLLSSRQMKPKRIAALMEEISIEEARVLLEALPETAAKSVLEALPPKRLAQIVSETKKKSTAPSTTNRETP
jgi:flagellar motility protein MotE (MotC chaperone)